MKKYLAFIEIEDSAEQPITINGETNSKLKELGYDVIYTCEINDDDPEKAIAYFSLIASDYCEAERKCKKNEEHSQRNSQKTSSKV